MKWFLSGEEPLSSSKLVFDNLEEVYKPILKKHGHAKVVLDVGAATGQWTNAIMQMMPNARYVAVEPLEEFRNKFYTMNHTELLPYAINSYCGKVLFNVSEDLYSSSLMYSGKNVISIDSHTLECVFGLLEIQEEEVLIKTDLQGFDYSAILSAGRYLKNMKYIQMECQLSPYTQNMTSLSQRIVEMYALDFYVLDVINLERRPSDGLLGQVDIIFKRKDSDYDSIVEWH
jgi:FkbM family methyltransferase